ncbi:MAG: hypothetical protein BWX50_00399 [Euryarchaeota archaeon ADurb.Bin009]|nr:MAG: hypothetical protein BWX50_00399 [Euryarchaeota archaeon ADurb.Bin009]
MNSPKLIRISPSSRISSTWPAIRRASAASSTRRTSPLRSLTVGPWIESTGTIPAALPGRSIFIWVPTARKSPRMCIVAGFKPAAANPVFRDRPRRRRNPPLRIGYEKTGRPPIRSRRYLSFGLTAAPLSSSSLFAAPPPPIISSSQSQPAIFIFLTFLTIFGAFRASPSATTSAIPPRTVFVSTRSRFR